MRREASFVSTQRGSLFNLVTRRIGVERARILFVPAFGDESNKSRVMTTLASRAFAEIGLTSYIFDPFGCGDSAGEFGDATWENWLEDLTFFYQKVRAIDERPVILWGLRTGALLIADWLAAQSKQETIPLLLWQPTLSGAQYVSHLFRLKAASQFGSQAGEARLLASAAREAVRQGQAIEIAGYSISSAMILGLEAVSFSLPTGYKAPVALIEAVQIGQTSHTPGMEKLISSLRADGIQLKTQATPASAFWQSTEIETAPAFIENSVAFVGEMLS